MGDPEATADQLGDPQTLTPFCKSMLMPGVAEHLAGRPCRLRWQTPEHSPESLGTCARDGDVAVITLRPDMPGGVTYRALLHEAAHARLHWHRLHDWAQGPQATIAWRTNPDQYKAQLAAYTAAITAKTLWDIREEREADDQARAWGDWALQHAETPALGHRLLALRSWAPEG